jgi:hypothetical protein
LLKLLVAAGRTSNKSFQGIQRLVILLGKSPKGAKDNQELDKKTFIWVVSMLSLPKNKRTKSRMLSMNGL